MSDVALLAVTLVATIEAVPPLTLKLGLLPQQQPPAGLTSFVQHACVAFYQPSQFWAQSRFDTSNVVRIDT